MPKKERSCLILFGAGIFVIASIFDGEGWIPSLLVMIPRYSTESCKKNHFSLRSQSRLAHVEVPLQDFEGALYCSIDDIAHYDDIIQVIYNALKSLKYYVHYLLKNSWCRSNSKWKSGGTEQSFMSVNNY